MHSMYLIVIVIFKSISSSNNFYVFAVLMFFSISNVHRFCQINGISFSHEKVL